jgi:hypothetical protein
MIGCSKAGRNTMMVRVATINTTIQGKQRARTTRHGTGHHLRASKKVKPATLTTKITACQNQMKAEINSLCCLISKLQAQRNSSTASSQWRLSSWTLGPNEALGEWSSLVHCDHEPVDVAARIHKIKFSDLEKEKPFQGCAGDMLPWLDRLSSLLTTETRAISRSTLWSLSEQR